MANKSKQISFFDSARRECRLLKYELQEDDNLKSSKLQVDMPLSDRDVRGMPGWISGPFAEMGKNDSLQNRGSVNALCEGMTIEIYSTDKVKRRTLMSTGVVLTGFSLVGTGEGEKRNVSLQFTAYVPANVTLHQWAWDHIHQTFYAQFEYSQTEIDWNAKAEDDEENDETIQSKSDNEPPPLDGDDEFSAPAVAARARRNKPGPVALPN